MQKLKLPDGLGSAPVDDQDFAACERVGQAIDATVTRWLSGRPGNRLYVTLATPNFAMGLSALVRSLRAVSDVPILVLTQGGFTPNVEAENVAALDVPPLLRVGQTTRPGMDHIPVTLSKLWVFSLTEPSRVAFIDADCLVLQPIDALFDGDGLAAVPDMFFHYETRGFNAGVFAFSPSPEIRTSLFRQMATLPADEGDQGILNVVFRDWRQLPQGFNFLRAHALVRAQAQDRALRVVHYTPSKPWVPEPFSARDPALAPLDDLWTERLTQDEHLALIREWRQRLAAAETNIASWIGGAEEGHRRRRHERHMRRWFIALAALQLVQAGLLAWAFLR